MIITRELINKNIKFHDLIVRGGLKLVSNDYEHLSKLIDGYKNFLLSKGAEPGHKVVIGERQTLRHIASVFACSELGLDICIVNQMEGNSPENLSHELKKLSPITYVLTDVESLVTPKIQRLSTICTNIIAPTEEEFDYSSNNIILAKPDTVFLSCVNSGINGKVITHSHEFIYHLIKRNSKMFYGKAAITSNLNHGSSPAAHFLPILVSERTTDVFTLLLHLHKMIHDFPNPTTMLSFLNSSDIKIDNMMVAYPTVVDDFLSNNPKEEQCILYTLSSLKDEWVNSVKNKNVKDIISLFGTSECSGPVLINQISDTNFNTKTYKKVDDFYGIELVNNNFTVSMPIYNKTVVTGDLFELTEDNRYMFTTIKYIPRVNEVVIDVNFYKELFKKNYDVDVELVLDLYNNKIHLVIWDKHVEQSIIKNMDDELRKNSNGLHFISKHAFLNKKDFNLATNQTLLKYIVEKL